MLPKSLPVATTVSTYVLARASMALGSLALASPGATLRSPLDTSILATVTPSISLPLISLTKLVTSPCLVTANLVASLKAFALSIKSVSLTPFRPVEVPNCASTFPLSEDKVSILPVTLPIDILVVIPISITKPKTVKAATYKTISIYLALLESPKRLFSKS